MFLLLARILVFSLWVILIGSVVACATTWQYDLPAIDEAYEREVKALRWFSIGEKEDEPLPAERRARVVTSWVAQKIDDIRLPEGGGRMGKGMAAGVRAADPNDFWAHTFKPRLKRFLPIFYLRVETYLWAYMTLFPLFLVCYFWGAYYGRIKMRSGVHKRNWPVQVLMWFLRTMNIAAVGATGFVLAPPVMYWMLPSFLIACVVVIMWRSYHIEML